MSAPLLLGASLLATYLRGRETSVYAFAKETGLPCDHLLKVIRGDRRRICVDLALDIETATAGAVPVRAWRIKDSPSPLRANSHGDNPRRDNRPTPVAEVVFASSAKIGGRCSLGLGAAR